MNVRHLAVALVATLALSACGAASNQPALPRGAQGLTALADGPKQGLAARQSARTAERSLNRYAQYLKEWERARTDAEKDRIEQDMLNELHSALDDVCNLTSANGHDQADRDAYDLSAKALDRYDRLFKEWERARTDAEKREIINDMLQDMVRALQAIKRIV